MGAQVECETIAADRRGSSTDPVLPLEHLHSITGAGQQQQALARPPGPAPMITTSLESGI